MAEGVVEAATLFKGKVHEIKWFDVHFVDDEGLPVPNVDFEIIYSNGEKKTARADGDGYFKDEKAIEGLVKIRLKDGSIIESYGNSKDFSGDDSDPNNTSDGKIQYIIRKRDTLSKIAKRFGVTGGWQALYRFVGPDGIPNSKRLKSGNPNLIYPGEILWLPTKRRVVYINTKNAAYAVREVRIRGKARTATQKRTAREEDVYEDRFHRQAVDNMLIAAGWDDNQNNLDGKKLSDTVKVTVKGLDPKLGNNWYLYIIQGNIMDQYNSNGVFRHKFVLSDALTGLAGMYAIFEVNGQLSLCAVYDRSSYLGGFGLSKTGEVRMDELIVGEEEKKMFVDDLVRIDVGTNTAFIKNQPIYYLAPSSKGQWQSIVLEGGRGFLDNYIGDEAYNRGIHERNIAVLKAYNAVYRGRLEKYMKDLDAIPVSKGEDAIRELGRPPEPYDFPFPEGYSPSQSRELVSCLTDISSYNAWLAISEKISKIQRERWPSAGPVHREGDLFFRAEFTLEPSVEEKINSELDKLAENLPVFGRLSSYRTVRLKWNFDLGTGDKLVQSGSSTTTVFKEDGMLKLGKYTIGAGREVEIDDSGGKRVTVKGTFGPYGFEASSDGEHALTGPFARSYSNIKTAEGGMGISVPIPGLGSIYVGIGFVGIRTETLMVYLTGAPGFFERKSPDTLVKTAWTNLEYGEAKKLEVLGWDQETWDIKDQLEYSQLPSSTRKNMDSLNQAEYIAALHLGFQQDYAANWLNFWQKLPPVKGVYAFKPMEIHARKK
jgi:hypothetical protein